MIERGATFDEFFYNRFDFGELLLFFFLLFFLPEDMSVIHTGDFLLWPSLRNTKAFVCLNLIMNEITLSRTVACPLREIQDASHWKRPCSFCAII